MTDTLKETPQAEAATATADAAASSAAAGSGAPGTGAAAPAGSTEGTYTYTADDADSSSVRERMELFADQLRVAFNDVYDGVLKRIPPDTVGHLNNSRKELLLAVRTLIDKEVSNIDKSTARAQELHAKKAAEKAAASASGTEKK